MCSRGALVIMTKERVALTIERGLGYLDAGADLVFVPLLVSPPAIRRLADVFGGRLSLMAMPGGANRKIPSSMPERRVSIGQIAMLAGLGQLRGIAEELRSAGAWSRIEANFFGFGEAEALFEGHRPPVNTIHASDTAEALPAHRR